MVGAWTLLFLFAGLGSQGALNPAGAPSKPLLLRYATFDPVRELPLTPIALSAAPGSRLAIVQFRDKPRESFLRELERRGATIWRYLPTHAYVISLPKDTNALVGLSFVRWVGPYHPAYKVDPVLLDLLGRGILGTQRYNIQVLQRGPSMKALVAERIRRVGGLVHRAVPNGFLLEATLSPQQLLEVVRMDEVFWVDLWSAPEADMDIAREIGGANFIEGVEGFTGAGVRGEVMDSNVRRTHVDFQNPPLLFHGPASGDASHGTSTTGIVFGSGVGNPQGRGMLPDAQGIFADFDSLTDRYQHTRELLQAPYFAVFQSNSWGDARTTQYTNKSFEMDDIIFQNDFLICQSQSNAGNQASRPQAWAKNVVSVGGVYHRNTLTKSDDAWNGGASIGPAADGRIKPDLTHFYDSIFTTASTSDTAYTSSFGGTSGATPIVAGHFGLFFQMWHKGVLGNFAPGHTVFDSRPHFTTAKAVLINTAESYPFSGLNHDLTRTHQGWGMPDLRNLHAWRNQLFLVNEEVALRVDETAEYLLYVPSGQPSLRVTMVYADPAGTTSSTLHRINDLDLKVIAPDGTVYWGNNGLLVGNWSTPGGEPNGVDTVENVFVQNPSPGAWTVQVYAREINQDQHLSTQEMDADFALVVSGVLADSWPTSLAIRQGSQTGGSVQSLERSDDTYAIVEARRPTSVAEPSIEVEVSGFTQVPAVGTVRLRVESAVTVPDSVEQSIEMFDFFQNNWVEVYRANASSDDDAAGVTVSASAARFVGSGGVMRCRVKYFDRGVTVVGWSARLDQVRWIVQP
jgi:hypothetical protein